MADDLMDAEGILLPIRRRGRGRRPVDSRRAGGGVPPVPRHRPARGLQLLSTLDTAPVGAGGRTAASRGTVGRPRSRAWSSRARPSRGVGSGGVLVAHGHGTPTDGDDPASTGSSSTSSSTTSSVPAGLACAARDLVTSVVGSQGAAGHLRAHLRPPQHLDDAVPHGRAIPGPSSSTPSGTELPTHVVSGGNYQFTNFAPAPVTLGAGGHGVLQPGVLRRAHRRPRRRARRRRRSR